MPTHLSRSTSLSFWFFLSVSTYDLPIDLVQATLRLLQPRPAPGARILVRRYGPSLRLAADALVALPEQRVHGHVVLLDVLPDLLGAPAREGRYLGGPVPLLPSDSPGIGPLGRLLPANTGHPRVVALQGPLQGL